MIVPLNSPEGRKRLEEATSTSIAVFESGVRGVNSECDVRSAVQLEVVASFRKQRGNTVCGLASLAVLLTARKRSLAKLKANANAKAKTKSSTHCGGERTIPTNANSNSNSNSRETVAADVAVPDLDGGDNCFVDEDDVYPMVTASNGDGTGIVSEEKIRNSGMTLAQVRALAEGLSTTEKAIALFPSISLVGEANTNTNKSTNTATRKTLSGPDDLRELVVEVLSSIPAREGLVLNYHMSTLGQVPFGGHLSPVAAYHEASDSLLVLDVWHTATEPVWASLVGYTTGGECDNHNDSIGVWEAISGIDPESLEPRGLLRLVHGKVHTPSPG